MWLLRTLKVAAVLTPLIPISLGYAICRIAGILYFLMNFRARGNILSNLESVDQGMRYPRKLMTTARVCVTVVTNYYDLLRLRSVDRDAVLDLVDVEGLEHVDAALERGCGAIIFTGHIGNFSVMARLPAAYGYRAAVIAEQVDPPELYTYMARLRSAMGIEVIAPGPNSLRRVWSLLSDNGLLLVAGDRDVTNRGMPVTFFGKKTMLPAGPVLLAMRTGAALIPAYTHRDSLNRSRVKIWPEMQMTCTGEWDADVQSNLRRVARYLEEMISLDPGQWAVLQRVWPPTSTYGRSEAIGSGDDYAAESVTQTRQEFERRAG